MTQRIKIFICAAIFVIGLIISVVGFSASQGTIAQIAVTNVIRYADLVNYTEEEITAIKDREIVRMLNDTALANGIKPYVFIGLSYHESDRFKQANKKRKDSNNRYSYGLFQVQLETALLYDKGATDSKLLSPSYNMHIAAVIFKSNLAKYHGNYEMALAAHNCGTVFNGQIKNGDFVKKVYAATGEFATKFN